MRSAVTRGVKPRRQATFGWWCCPKLVLITCLAVTREACAAQAIPEQEIALVQKWFSDVSSIILSCEMVSTEQARPHSSDPSDRHAVARHPTTIRHFESHCQGRFVCLSRGESGDPNLETSYGHYSDRSRTLLIAPRAGEARLVSGYHSGLGLGVRPSLFLGLRGGVSLRGALSAALQDRTAVIQLDPGEIRWEIPYFGERVQGTFLRDPLRLRDLTFKNSQGRTVLRLICVDWAVDANHLPIAGEIISTADGLEDAHYSVRMSWMRDRSYAPDTVIRLLGSMPILVLEDGRECYTAEGVALRIGQQAWRLRCGEDPAAAPLPKPSWDNFAIAEPTAVANMKDPEWPTLSDELLARFRFTRKDLTDGYCGEVAVMLLAMRRTGACPTHLFASPRRLMSLADLAVTARGIDLETTAYRIPASYLCDIPEEFLVIRGQRLEGPDVRHVALAVPFGKYAVVADGVQGGDLRKMELASGTGEVDVLVTEKGATHIKRRVFWGRVLTGAYVVGLVGFVCLVASFLRNRRKLGGMLVPVAGLGLAIAVSSCCRSDAAASSKESLSMEASTTDVRFAKWESSTTLDFTVLNSSEKGRVLRIEAPDCTCAVPDRETVAVPALGQGLFRVTLRPKVVGSYRQRIAVVDPTDGARAHCSISIVMGAGMFVTPASFNMSVTASSLISEPFLQVSIDRRLMAGQAPHWQIDCLQPVDVLLEEDVQVKSLDLDLCVYSCRLIVPRTCPRDCYRVRIAFTCGREQTHAEGYLSVW